MKTTEIPGRLSVGAGLQRRARLGGLGVAMLSIGLIVSPGGIARGEIPFRSGRHVPAAGTAQATAERLAELAARPEDHHLVVQFDRPLTSVERSQLSEVGLRLLSALGDNAFFASTTTEAVDVQAITKVVGMIEASAIATDWKLHPEIIANRIPMHAVVDKTDPDNPIVAAYLLLHLDIDLATTGVATAARHGAAVRDVLESVNGLVIEFPWRRLAALAGEDAVQWLEWPLPPMGEINDSNRAVTEANIVQAAPYGLDGTGVTVLVYDGGTARSTHLDFQGRLSTHDASGLSDHSTHVACTVGGAGVANATYKGMAPGAELLSYGFQYDGTGIFLYSNPGDLESDYDEAINTFGAHISNNSIGTNTETNGFDCAIQGDYGVTSQLIDSIVNGSLGAPFRVVWANGNERQGSRCDVEGYGDYYSTAPPAGAKNHIAVGALNSNDDSMTSFSSWGPLDDGRMKPDVSAPGCEAGGDFGVTSCSSASDTSYASKCGTSMASPTVCGLSSLLLEDFRAQFPSEPDFRNSTLKILLAHNAIDRGNVGPDYQFGYGSVRIQQTIDFMRTGSFLENQVDQGATYSVLVVVDAGTPALKVTLAWDDVPGTPNANPALVNDLDLRVFDPSSQQHNPWTLDPSNPSAPAVRTAANHVDNIEQVLVDNPAAGVWRVDVYGFNVAQGPQSFSLCSSPELVACSSTGTIALDASKYQCADTIGIQVIDCDLNANNSVIETVTVTVASDSELGGESVVLTETAAESADFRGSLPVDGVDSSGVLLVADGDAVTATYLDADDGQGGQNVSVVATAAVDCTPPAISGVQTANLGPFSATVTFNTNEPARGTVRYGLACGSLTDSASETGFPTAHLVNLTGLTENTTYFYAVDAVDEAGNAGTDDNGGACYGFGTTDVPNYFTELFTADNDLDNLSLIFTPDASFDFYAGCAEPITALPVDPSGGTVLSLSDDSYATVTLSGGQTVSLYDTSYATFYVGSNGFVTFTLGDADYTESLADHFNRPRVAALFDDLNPATAGTISWKQLADRAVVTWQNVPEYGTANANTFQVEMQFSGTIVISYLDLAALDGLAGLANGGGLPSDFFESDLSAMEPCGPPACDDGIQNQGEDRIDCGGPCPPCDCLSDAACADGQYCNGAETCDAWGHCQPGTAVDCSDGVGCTIDSCNEGTDSCDNLADDAACADGLFCNGVERCDVALDCQPGTDPCPGQGCDEANDQCVVCDDNGVCEVGEDCTSCPNDCISGGDGGCGNGVCEPALSEDCLSCPADCRGLQGGKPSKRFCCGDGDGENPVGCSQAVCTTDGWACSAAPVASYCCGDLVCEGAEDYLNCIVDCPAPVCGDDLCDPGEDSCNCPADCGSPPPTESNCSNGLDDDCDGLTDAADPDCACGGTGQPCTLAAQCCSNRCVRNVCK